MNPILHEHRTQAMLTQDGTLTLEQLPFQSGDLVEVIITSNTLVPPVANHYALRGLPVQYERPTDPVAEEDWNT